MAAVAGLNDIGTTTVGVLYPVDRLRASGEWDDVAARIAAVDPRIVVVGEEYVEPHSLRAIRPSLSADDARRLAPELTERQRAVLARIDVAFALDLPPDIATHAPRLRWVQAFGAGIAQLLSSGLADAGIRLTSGAGANADAIAEFAIGRLLQHWKGFRGLDELQAGRVWRPAGGRQLGGSTVGLIGLGAINTAVARRLAAFDVRVLATRRSATSRTVSPDVEVVFPVDELHVMVAECDAVIAAVPGTSESDGMIDEAAIAAMKPGAFFVNVGRGSLVREEALIEALASGHLSGAALDVTVREPLPADDPLWDAPNLYLSPHSATAGGAMLPNIVSLLCENLRRYLAGEPLLNEVDPARGY